MQWGNGEKWWPYKTWYVLIVSVWQLTDLGSYHSWSHRVSEYGIDEAIRISRFENMHPRAMAGYAREYEIDCDVEQLDTVDAYFDEGGFNRAKAAVHEILQNIPELNYKIHTAEEAQENFRLAPTCVGAITYAAGKIWPYKFVSQIIQLLVTDGVNIQTETPATGVTRDGDKWRIITPQGSILAEHIVHATNGYTEYLLPEFHDLITPTRGHMTAQIPPTSLSVPPLKHTYSFIYSKGRFDYFIQQPEYDGCKLMLGGGYYEDPCPTSYEDNTTSEEAQRYLSQQLPKVFKWKGEEDPEKRVYMKWSGIMGFSGDGLPWVGPLSDELGGKGQWVCAGYTGEGIRLPFAANGQEW
jgi:glycine/D-amino acid oxidase-like deaminating enzyme